MSKREHVHDRDEDPIWVRQGGEGLPLPERNDRDSEVWLFTCVECGFRAANPPGPLAKCCGEEENVVCHRIDFEKYMNIKHYGDPRGKDDE